MLILYIAHLHIQNELKIIKYFMYYILTEYSLTLKKKTLIHNKQLFNMFY